MCGSLEGDIQTLPPPSPVDNDTHAVSQHARKDTARPIPLIDVRDDLLCIVKVVVFMFVLRCFSVLTSSNYCHGFLLGSSAKQRAHALASWMFVILLSRVRAAMVRKNGVHDYPVVYAVCARTGQWSLTEKLWRVSTCCLACVRRRPKCNLSQHPRPHRYHAPATTG